MIYIYIYIFFFFLSISGRIRIRIFFKLSRIRIRGKKYRILIPVFKEYKSKIKRVILYSLVNLNCDMTVMHYSSCRYDEDSDRTRTSSHRDDRKEDRLTSSASSVHSEDAAGETRVSASRSIINTSIAQVCISSSLIL